MVVCAMAMANGPRTLMEQATRTKEIMLMIKSMAMECTSGSLEIGIKEILPMICEKDMEKCIGKMALSTRESGNNGNQSGYGG